MISKLALVISVTGLINFIITGIFNIIMDGIYGLREKKYKLMGSIAISAVSLGVFLITKPII